MVFKKIKSAFSGPREDEFVDEEYLEIDLDQGKQDSKILVKLFELREYDDANAIINALREGYTIAIIDIKMLKKKDPIELKRAISKIRKTIEALEGNITGFGGTDIIVATPSFAKVEKEAPRVKSERRHYDEF
ncbi:cell division protein SepF [archaeon]|jgi:SepF-like predicted cell division protein (DUF552 family)|nr:cell division protein SepF [archaeon]